MNHRMGKRIQSAQPVTLEVTGLGKLNGRLKNISLSGAAVLCEEVHLLETYLPVNLSLLVHDGEQPAVVNVEGFVVRLKGGLIGIMFMHEMIGLLQRLPPDVDDLDMGMEQHYVYSSS
ncbi:MAG: PilZ domain-containing protein [Candidatus Thiodiazotropha sp.]|jgi:hypothetical protein